MILLSTHIKKVFPAAIRAMVLVPYLALPTLLKSQAYNSVEDSLIRSAADSLIYAYQWYGSLTEDDETISENYMITFKGLFAPSAFVFNDINTPVDTGKNITVDDYINGVRQMFPMGISISLEEVDIDDPQRSADKKSGYIKAYAVKNIVGLTTGDDYYNETFDVTLTIGYDAGLTDFKILGIREKQAVMYEITYIVQDVESGVTIPNLEMWLFFHNEVKQKRFTNADGVVRFSEIPEGTRIAVSVAEDQGYEKETTQERPVSEWAEEDGEQRKIYLKRSRRWTGLSLGAYFAGGISGISSNNMETNHTTVTYSSDNMLGYRGGFSFSWYPFRKDKLALGIRSGVGIEHYRSKIGFTGYVQDPSPLMVDVEGDQMSLLVDAETLSDLLQLTCLNVPLLLSFRFIRPSGWIEHFYLAGGVSFSSVLINTHELDGTASYRGYYPEWDITLSDIEELGYVSNALVRDESEWKVKNNNLSIQANAGISMPLIKPALAIHIGFEILYGIADIGEYDYENYYFSMGYGSYESLAGATDRLGTFFYGISAGITYDFRK
jgi:hypothetical protein